MFIQQEQRPIDNEIGQEIMVAMPEDWLEATLTAELTETGTSESYKIAIRPEPGQQGIALVSDGLQDAVRKLFLLHKKYSTGLLVARYIVKNTRGNWSLVSEFQYAE